MRRLRRLPAQEPVDRRPALLSIVALMFLLLPLLLLTTSTQKLSALGLQLAHAQGSALPSGGPLERLEVRLLGDELTIRAALRTLDVTAGEGDTTWRVVSLPGIGGEPDLAGLQRELRIVQQLDPGNGRVEVLPADDTPVQRVVALVDAVGGDPDQPLFPEVVLAQSSAEEP